MCIAEIHLYDNADITIPSYYTFKCPEISDFDIHPQHHESQKTCVHADINPVMVSITMSL